jgi:hypothetical protein
MIPLSFQKKQKQTKPQIRRQKEIIMEFNEIGTKRTLQRIKKQRAGFF